MWLLNWFHLSKEKETIDGAFDRSVCASYKQNKNKPHRHSSPDLNKGGLAAPASPLFVEDRGKKKKEKLGRESYLDFARRARLE